MSEVNWTPYTAVGAGIKVGLYDTQDNVWLGDEKGPVLFDQETLEQATLNEMRAEVTGRQLNYGMIRVRVKEWVPRHVHLRDNVDFTKSAEQALIELESGQY